MYSWTNIRNRSAYLPVSELDLKLINAILAISIRLKILNKHTRRVEREKNMVENSKKMLSKIFVFTEK